MTQQTTHIVIDKIFTEEEGQQAFSGSYVECNEWIEEQAQHGQVFTYEIIPIHSQKANSL